MLIEELLSICFQLTLFALFSIAVYKLLKQYVIPLLYQEIEDIKENQKNLKEKENLLLLSQQRLENEIRKQENKFLTLEEKIKHWHELVVLENKKQQESNVLLFEKIEEKRIRQIKNLNLLKMEEFVVPRSIKRAYKEINILFGGKRGEDLLQELIESIDPEKR